MKNTIALSSDVGDSMKEAHSTGSFVNELNAFLQAFLKNNQEINEQTINDFITRAKEMGIDVRIID